MNFSSNDGQSNNFQDDFSAKVLNYLLTGLKAIKKVSFYVLARHQKSLNYAIANKEYTVYAQLIIPWITSLVCNGLFVVLLSEILHNGYRLDVSGQFHCKFLKSEKFEIPLNLYVQIFAINFSVRLAIATG